MKIFVIPKKKALILCFAILIIVYVILSYFSVNYQGALAIELSCNSVISEDFKERINNLTKGDEKIAYLTFDDGPSKGATPKVLDILKEEDVKATFFVIGKYVEERPELVKRAYDEGHYIANHGYSHSYSKIYASVDTVLDEYYNTESAIRIAIGNDQYTSLLFRFPGGSSGGKYKELKRQAEEKLKENNIAYVDWNVLTGDSEGGKKTVQQLVSRFKETIGTKNSIVILMHDAGDKMTTYEALPQIIQSLRDNGYEFKNFYDLIK